MESTNDIYSNLCCSCMICYPCFFMILTNLNPFLHMLKYIGTFVSIHGDTCICQNLPGVIHVAVSTLLCRWHHCVNSAVSMTSLCQLCDVNDIIVLTLRCQWHHCVNSGVSMTSLCQLCDVIDIAVPTLLCRWLWLSLAFWCPLRSQAKR